MSAVDRRRLVAAVVTAVVVLAAVAYGVVFLGNRSHAPQAAGITGSDDGGVPATCPLTGTHPAHGVPSRPALAVKVENLPAARPQTGLGAADIVYEEPVEAGITRFIAVYQCRDAARIEPVRSARLTDPDILDQLGRPLFAYAGGVPEVVAKVRRARLVDVNFNTAAAAHAYHRDPSRFAPHNLFTSTKELYGSTGRHGARPGPLFVYSEALPPATAPGARVHLPFSTSSDVFWRYRPSRHRYFRWHGSVPHTLSDGSQVSAANVVVQVVRVTMTDITDANGVRSPEVVATGSGRAYVFRGGRVIKGRWVRPSLRDVTRFVDRSGHDIPLAPGSTWVELFPAGIGVAIG